AALTPASSAVSAIALMHARLSSARQIILFINGYSSKHTCRFFHARSAYPHHRNFVNPSLDGAAHYTEPRSGVQENARDTWWPHSSSIRTGCGRKLCASGERTID